MNISFMLTWLDLIMLGGAALLYWFGVRNGTKTGKHEAYKEERLWRLEEKVEVMEDKAKEKESG